MIYCNGRRGKSKAEVRLSIDTIMEQVVLYVWEKGKITHVFHPDRIFLEAMVEQASDKLKAMEKKLES